MIFVQYDKVKYKKVYRLILHDKKGKLTSFEFYNCGLIANTENRCTGSIFLHKQEPEEMCLEKGRAIDPVAG